jgi:hypothetical protein
MNILRLCFILILAIQPSLSGFSQDTTKVLFIGNSFMSFNDLPTLFSQLAEGSGEHVVVASHVPGGASVGDTIQGTFAHMYNPEVYALIKSNDWDYLFLQDRQSRFAMSRGIFPGDSKVIEGHIKIRDSLLFYHPCSHLIWFAGFGTKNGYPPYSTTGVGLIDSIYQNYRCLIDTAGQVIAPIGPAYLRIIANFPAIDLWGPDEEHPSMKGSMLIASVLYTTVFKSSPVVSSFNPGIPVEEDSILNMTGYQTTIDSLSFTGLAGITPPVIQDGDSLYVFGYQDCNWFFNGSPFPSDNCGAFMTQPGYYYAVVTDAHGCTFRTREQYYSVFTGTDELPDEAGAFFVFPDPVFTKLKVISEVPLKKLSFYNASGVMMQELMDPSNQTELDVSGWSKGLYLIIGVREDGTRYQKKVFKR